MGIFTGIGAAIASAAAAVSTFMAAIGPVGAFLLKAAVGIGVNLLLAAIAGKPKDPTFSINSTIQGGGDVPRSFVMGEFMVAGSLLYANTWGKDGETDNAYLTQVIALSDLPVTSFTTLWTNGEETPVFPKSAVVSVGDGGAAGLEAINLFKITFGILDDFLFKIGREATGNKLDFIFDWLETTITGLGQIPVRNVEQGEMGFPVPAYEKEGPNLWVKFYDGNQSVADSFIRLRVANTKRPWDTNRIGKGVAYAIMTSRVTKNMFSGIPSFKFVVRGIPLYDISKDDTQGGEGDHRWDDPDTWGGDGDFNPAVQAYNILRGIYYEGEWFYGLQGMNASRLPPDNWIAAIEKCRTPITGENGPEPTYRSSCEISVDIPIGDTLDQLCTTCAGRITEEGGIYRMFVGMPDEATFAITDEDILSTAQQEFTPFYGLADSVNGVHANYPEPKDGWNMKSAPDIFRTDLQAKHGGRILMADIDLPFVPYAEQVQRLMRSTILEAERARRHTFRLPAKYWAYAVPGYTFSWDSERNGYEVKLFRIDGVADEPNLDVLIDVTEVDPTDYDWDSEADYVPPLIAPSGPVRPTPQPIIDFFAEGDVVTGDGEKMRPAIRLEWDNTKVDIIGLEFQVRLKATAVAVHESRTDDYAAGALKISNNLFSLTEYQVRARWIPQSDRDVLWSGWLDVTTPDVRYTDVLATLDNASSDLKGLLEDTRQLVLQTRSKLRDLALSVIEGTRQAVHSESIAVRDRDAFAAALIEMDATIDEVNNELIAQASILAAVEAVVGDTSSGVFWRMQALAGAGDIEARYDLQVRSDIADSFISSGLILEAGYTGGDPLLPFSRVVLYGQEVVIADHLGNVSTLFDSDGVYINNARIFELDSTNIKSRSIQGDRIVTLGVDTPELALDSVTYVDSANTSTPAAIQSLTPTAPKLTVMVDDYVSGGILGAASVRAVLQPHPVFTINNYQFIVVRDSVPTFDSTPVTVGGFPIQIEATWFGTGGYISWGFSDVPPSAGDWYYCIMAAATLGDSDGLTTQSITVSHAKR